MSLIAAPVLVLASAASALADCHSVRGDEDGLGAVHVGATGSTQLTGWELNGRGVRVKSTTGSGMSNSICLDSFMDWMTVSGHFDLRGARNCANGTTIESDPGGDHWQPETTWGGRVVVGKLKNAISLRLWLGMTSHIDSGSVARTAHRTTSTEAT
jgi:hypothetical protein